MMRHAYCAMTTLAVVALLLSAQARADDEPEIAVEAVPTEIFVGESVDYAVEIRNVKSPSPPDLSALRPDFDVVANGNESRNQSSTVIFNGRMTQQNIFGHVYRFRLTPKRAGKLVIPAPSVTIDGKTISGRSLDLQRDRRRIPRPGRRRDENGSRQSLPHAALRGHTPGARLPLPSDPDRDPLGPLRRRPPHIEVNWVDVPAGLSGEDKAHWLQKFLSEDGSGFALNDVTMRSGSSFSTDRGWRCSICTRGAKAGMASMASPINYFVYELKRKLTAEKAGTYILGPAVVKGSFVDGVREKHLQGPAAGRGRTCGLGRGVAKSRSPRPATFCGGIGDYRLVASASPTALRVGDPLTLTLDFERGQTADRWT